MISWKKKFSLSLMLNPEKLLSWDFTHFAFLKSYFFFFIFSFSTEFNILKYQNNYNLDTCYTKTVSMCVCGVGVGVGEGVIKTWTILLPLIKYTMLQFIDGIEFTVFDMIKV